MAKKELDRFETNFKKNIQIKTKLLGMTIGAVILGCAITFTIVINVFNNKQLAREKELVEVNSNGLYRVIEDWKLQLVQYTYLISINEKLGEAITRGIIATEALILEITDNLDFDFFAVTDKNAKILTRNDLNGNLTNSKAVKTALQGKLACYYEAVGSQEYAIVCAAPIYFNGELTGLIITGYALNNGLLCEEAIEGYQLECAVFKDNIYVETTLKNKDGKSLNGKVLDDQQILNTVLKNGKNYIGSVELNGENFAACYMPIICEDGTITGMLFAARSLKTLEEARTATIKFVGPIVFVMLVLMTFFASFFVGWLMDRIKTVTNSLKEMASGEADLTKRCALYKRDEIGFLVIQFDAFCDKLQQIVGEIKSSKSELTETGDHLAISIDDATDAINEISTGIDDIHSQIRTSTESVNHTASAVDEIIENIATLDNMIESQSQEVSEAASAVEEMIGNISSVNISVEKMAGSFEGLSENAENGFKKQQDVNEKIKQIEVQSEMLQEANLAISAIAEQTNLLAMNAAIEAAHAGEAGKGFSVVADEIRKLSETSSEQSKTIGDQLNKIREQISEVVSASVETSEAFNQVSKKITETDQLVIHIKAAMEEQNAGSKQIGEALGSMNDSTTEVNNASKNMARKNKEIQEEINKLKEITKFMGESMEEMSASSKQVSSSGVELGKMSDRVKESINKIGSQIDLFKV